MMHIPFVVASGSQDPEQVRAVYALNANCFMRKPSDLTQFLKFVETCCARAFVDVAWLPRNDSD